MGDLFFAEVVSRSDSIHPVLEAFLVILFLLAFVGAAYLVYWGFFGNKGEIKPRASMENPILEDRDVLGLVKPMGNMEQSDELPGINGVAENANETRQE